MPKDIRVPARRVAVCLLLAAGCSAPAPESAPPRPAAVVTEPEQMHRIYDFEPVGPSNPVVARAAGTPIEIPLSEFRAFLRMEVNDEERAALDAEGKRRKLEQLLDDHVLLLDAYRKGADKGKRASEMLEGTRRMLLAEFLTKEEVTDKAKSGEEEQRLASALRDRLFSRASVVVSNEVYAELKKVAAAAGEPDPDALPAALAEKTIATCKDVTVTAGQVWRTWAELTPQKRTDLAKEAGLSEVLKGLLEEGLKVEEALARGIDKTLPLRRKVQENRAAITRMWFQDQVTSETVERMKTPETEGRVRQYYQELLATRYTYKDEKGRTKVVSYDADRESIRNDYFDHLREITRAEKAKALRQGMKIEVDETLVAGA